MNLTSKQNIRELFRKHHIRPSKKLGQNFLINNKIIKRIVKTAKLQPNDTVLEIGPGLGNLTREIAEKAKKVIAVEKDLKMTEILRENLKDFKNIEIINKDILKFSLPADYKVTANLPFYLTAPVIREFLESSSPPKEMVLVVQKEVAQRICAKIPKMNLLAVSVQFYARPKIVSYISKKSFWPQPKVDSAIIRIVPYQTCLSPQFRKQFFKIVKAGFSHPRKQLANNLSKGLGLNKEQAIFWLLENSIQPSQRAESLNIDNWVKLTKSFNFK